MLADAARHRAGGLCLARMDRAGQARRRGRVPPSQVLRGTWATTPDSLPLDGDKGAHPAERLMLRKMMRDEERASWARRRLKILIPAFVAVVVAAVLAGRGLGDQAHPGAAMASDLVLARSLHDHRPMTFLGGATVRLFIGHLFDFITKRQDQKNELARLTLQGQARRQRTRATSEAIKVQADLGVKVIEAQTGARHQAGADAFYRRRAGTGQRTGIMWVDLWNGIVRPLLASMCIVLWVAKIVGAGFVPDEWDRELMGWPWASSSADASTRRADEASLSSRWGPRRCAGGSMAAGCARTCARPVCPPSATAARATWTAAPWRSPTRRSRAPRPAGCCW